MEGLWCSVVANLWIIFLVIEGLLNFGWPLGCVITWAFFVDKKEREAEANNEQPYPW